MNAHTPLPKMDSSLIDRFLSCVNNDGSGCHEWQRATNAQGYGIFKIGRRQQFIASRVAYFIHHEEDPASLIVCHTCDNPPCCNPQHLFLGTHKDNALDSLAKGRDAAAKGYRWASVNKGEQNAQAKLTESLVREIRATPMSQRKLAEIYGISQTQISKIVRKQAWKHIV